ncbi:hypothetical protein BpHYR1_012628 [Brachionus plicatilis]|uniref:Uncharacterized protein n=1 Tax=Brachionus plicatilis TaxID=10195 RepID=A0A3M7SUR0_BRAPC|nr:hypothetical protein BpHYR1_012628 [Brachionus plicatilis]
MALIPLAYPTSISLQVNNGKSALESDSSVNSLSNSTDFGPKRFIAVYKEVTSLIKTLLSSGKCSLNHLMLRVQFELRNNHFRSLHDDFAYQCAQLYQLDSQYHSNKYAAKSRQLLFQLT